MVQGRERVLLLVAVSAVVTVAVTVAAVPRQDTTSAQDVADPWDGVYNDCLSTWSLPCIQRKLLVFIDRIGRVKSKCKGSVVPFLVISFTEFLNK